MTQPSVRVKFGNPQYNPSTKKFKVDVLFQSDSPQQRLAQMNVRFFFDAVKLLPSKVVFTDFASGYSIQSMAGLGTSPTLGGAFGLVNKPMTVVNWAVQLSNPAAAPIHMSTDPVLWTKLWAVELETPLILPAGTSFAPALIWSRQDIVEGPGYANIPPIVITTVLSTDGTVNGTKTQPVLEFAEHFNWTDFTGSAIPYGAPNNLNALAV